MFLMNTQTGNYGNIHSGNPVALFPGRRLKMCRTFWFWIILSLITLFYPVLRQLEVSSNLLWILEMKERMDLSKIHWLAIPPKLQSLEKAEPELRHVLAPGSQLRPSPLWRLEHWDFPSFLSVTVSRKPKGEPWALHRRGYVKNILQGLKHFSFKLFLSRALTQLPVLNVVPSGG